MNHVLLECSRFPTNGRQKAISWSWCRRQGSKTPSGRPSTPAVASTAASWLRSSPALPWTTTCPSGSWFSTTKTVRSPTNAEPSLSSSSSVSRVINSPSGQLSAWWAPYSWPYFSLIQTYDRLVLAQMRRSLDQDPMYVPPSSISNPTWLNHLKSLL